MATAAPQQPSGSSGREGYTHGYATASQTMATRTADTFATFLLPHLTSGMRLLDVGCGPGTITVGLAERVAPGEAVGVDIGPSEVECAKANATESGVTNLTFEIGEATALPFPNGRFDAVFSCATLEHVPQREGAIKEMYRVLRRGGIIGLRGGVVSGSIVQPQTSEWVDLWHIYSAVAVHNGMNPDFGIEQPRLLLDAGFTNLKVTGYYESRNPDGRDYAQRIVAPRFVEQATALGVADEGRLRHLSKAIEARGRRPDAFMLVAWVDVVGWKD